MIKPSTLLKSERLGVVDALRGFALMAIVLLHNLEHYNIYHLPEGQPSWLDSLDKGVWDTVFFLFAGKAFATFSLLFGFSFFIQMDNQARKGNDFRLRFAWRLFLLALFAQLHALFYNGDILLLYAFCGFFLIPVARLSNKLVLVIATVLVSQPFEWYRMIRALMDPAYVTDVGSRFMVYANRCWGATTDGSFLEVLVSNIGDGQLYSNFWQVENGRLFLVPGLFMFGLLLGRLRYFVKNDRSLRFWRRLLPASFIVFLVLTALKILLVDWVGLQSDSFKIAYGVAIGSYVNFSMMCILVSLFVLFWFRVEDGYRIQRFLIPYGRMSLTNYIFQSIIGCFIYYGYGLGLWHSSGATCSLLIGIGIFLFQRAYSCYWLSRFRQGPLEYLWKRLTWLGKAGR